MGVSSYSQEGNLTLESSTHQLQLAVFSQHEVHSNRIYP